VSAKTRSNPERGNQKRLDFEANFRRENGTWKRAAIAYMRGSARQQQAAGRIDETGFRELTNGEANIRGYRHKSPKNCFVATRV